MADSNLELWARSIVIEACRRELKRPITLEEVQAVQTIGRLESTYGRGWSNSRNGPGSEDSKNWGAIQFIRGKASDLVIGSFVTRDSHRDGSTYTFPYCSYPTDVAGCRHVVRLLEQMGVLEVARKTRHIRAVSSQLGRRGYYEGSGKTAAEAYWNHFQACLRNLRIIRAGCGDEEGRGLDYDDTESAQSGTTYLDEDNEDQAGEREEAPSRGSESPSGSSEEGSEATPVDQEEDLKASVVREREPVPVAGPSALDTPYRAPVAPLPARPMAGAKLVGAIIAALWAIFIAYQCSGCTPAQTATARNLIGVVADWGPELCALLDSEHERLACRAAARIVEQLEALAEADASARPAEGGAGGAPVVAPSGGKGGGR